MGEGKNIWTKSGLGSGLLRAAPALLVVFGLALIGTAWALRWQADERQEALLRAYDAGVTLASPGAAPGSGAPVGGAASGESALTDTALVPLCLLRIPQIDLEVAVAEGLDPNTLRCAAGHFEGTALPGQAGNFCVAAHRAAAFGEFFHRLDEVEVGDRVVAESGGQSYSYVVSEVLVVEPEDTSVLAPTPEPTITLVTCTGARFAHRLIIKGVLGP